jgi:hypothetical protein
MQEYFIVSWPRDLFTVTTTLSCPKVDGANEIERLAMAWYQEQNALAANSRCYASGQLCDVKGRFQAEKQWCFKLFKRKNES